MPMKTRMFITALLLAFISGTLSTYAHSIGTTEKGHTQRLWTDAPAKKSYIASFLLVHWGEVFLEDASGKVVSIPLNHLSAEDLAIAEEHRERIKSLNQNASTIASPTLWERYCSRYAALPLASLALGGLCFVLAIWFVRRHRPNLRIAVLAGASLFIMTALYVESQTATTSINDAFAPFSSFIKTHQDATYFYVESNGIPQHTMMVGIKSWQQQVPTLQAYTGSNAWSIPLKPVLAANPISTKTALYTGAIALAVNGVPIFNALNNRGDDALLFGELDNWGGHCGKADDYHYHTAPLHLQNIVGTNKPIAYALDGYAIYGGNEPDGSAMKTLDSYNGHTGSDGVYHYHGTTTYPYTCGSMRGVVTVQNDQIIPQSRSVPVRPPYMPLNGAIITGCTAVGTNGYSLEYTLNGQKYYVNYSWTPQGLYTFVYIDAADAQRTETFQGAAIAVTPPALALSTSTIAFGTVNIGSGSVLPYTISASNLSASLVVTAPSGFSLSTSATGSFTQALTLSPINTMVLQTVYVRVAPTQAGALSGTITHASGNATFSGVALSATAQQSTGILGFNAETVQAYPNPFTESVRIGYQLQAAVSAVECRVSDAGGRTLAVIPLGALPAGQHTMEWNGRTYDGAACPTGAYFISFFVGGRKQSTVSVLKR